MINKTRVGPWGTDNFNVSWWRLTFKDVGTYMWNQDVPRWANIAPIKNVIAPGYTYTDSLNIVAAINELCASNRPFRDTYSFDIFIIFVT
jgi:hypothetical protein